MNKDCIIHYLYLYGTGMTKKMLPKLIVMCSVAMGRPGQTSMFVIGVFSFGGTIMKANNPASTLIVCFDSGAKKV
jgi:ATP-dependent Lon protease